MSNLSLYIFGDVVEHVEHYEYLGIIVDDKLSFKNHRASNVPIGLTIKYTN